MSTISQADVVIRSSLHSTKTSVEPDSNYLSTTEDLNKNVSKSTTDLSKLHTAVTLVQSVQRMKSIFDNNITYDEAILDNESPDPQDLQIRNGIIYLLRKSGKRRTDKEVDFLKRCFLRIKFIEEMENELDPETFNRLFRELRYECTAKGGAVFKYGNIYPIISKII